MGYSILPTVLTVIGSCLFRIAWVLIVLPRFGSFQSIIIVYPISWALTGIMFLIAYAAICHRQKKVKGRCDPSPLV